MKCGSRTSASSSAPSRAQRCGRSRSRSTEGRGDRLAASLRLLYQLDEDFCELFKVKAEFAPEIFAVASLIEYGARLREHQRKLSTRLLEISDVVADAGFWAGKAGRELVQAEDVEQAVTEKEYRSKLVEERVRELMADGTIVIETGASAWGM